MQPVDKCVIVAVCHARIDVAQSKSFGFILILVLVGATLTGSTRCYLRWIQ